MTSLSRLSMRTKSLPRPWYLKNSAEGKAEACPRGTLDLGPEADALVTTEVPRRVAVVVVRLIAADAGTEEQSAMADMMFYFFEGRVG